MLKKYTAIYLYKLLRKLLKLILVKNNKQFLFIQDKNEKFVEIQQQCEKSQLDKTSDVFFKLNINYSFQNYVDLC